MSRVIAFSRAFPSYHPKAGQPTYFVEKVVKSLHWDRPHPPVDIRSDFDSDIYINVNPKHHTIRAGHRWKVGDWFQPAVWGNDINPKSGRSGPYHSKMIKFTPEIQIKKLFDLDIEGTDWYINGRRECALSGEGFDKNQLALNDGLTLVDLDDWFTLSPDFKKKQVFSGQIICHNENIEY